MSGEDQLSELTERIAEIETVASLLVDAASIVHTAQDKDAERLVLGVFALERMIKAASALAGDLKVQP